MTHQMIGQVDEVAARAYNTPDFTLRMPDLSKLGETLPIRVGEVVPSFEAARLEGGKYTFSAGLLQHDIVLMMGSITSPMCAMHLPAMNDLATSFAPLGIDCYLLYTKESHPGERYPHHVSFDQKLAYAQDLRRLEGVRFPILVDALDGRVHRLLGPWPTSLFVIRRDGVLVYRATIADPRELAVFLDQLVAARALAVDADRIPHVGYAERLIEYTPDENAHYRVYERAGPKAFEDYWRAFPHLRDRWPRSGRPGA